MTTKILLKTYYPLTGSDLIFKSLSVFSPFFFPFLYPFRSIDFRLSIAPSRAIEIKNCNRNCIEPRNPIDSEGLRIRSLFCFLKSLHVGVAESHVKRRDGRFCYGGGERERGRRGEKRKKKRKREKEKKYRACLHHRHRARGVRVRGI